MTYSKGRRMIAVEYTGAINPCKRPGLFIGENNHFLKLASFRNEKEAKLFEEFLEYFFGDLLRNNDKEE